MCKLFQVEQVIKVPLVEKVRLFFTNSDKIYFFPTLLSGSFFFRQIALFVQAILKLHLKKIDPQQSYLSMKIDLNSFYISHMEK